MADIPKKIFVSELACGQPVQTTFALAAIALRDYSGGRYLQLKLSDRTGKIHGVMWSGADKVYPQLNVGDLVAIRGKVERYREQLQLQVHHISRLDEAEELDLNDYLRTAEIDVEAVWQELVALGRQVNDPRLAAVLELFFQDEALRTGFLRAPGGKQWHHAYIGGLAEHTLAVVRNCLALAELYPRANRDLLILGAILHDLGKVEELSHATAIEYTDAGRLVGHQVISHQLLCQYLSQLTDFPEHLALQLQHLILSHHGETEDAVRRPMTYEAIILSRADDLDAQLNAYGRELDRAAKLGRPWTDYVNLINRFLYLGPQESDADELQESEDTPPGAPLAVD